MVLNYLSHQRCDHVCYELFQGSPMQGRKCSWVGTAWKIPNTACDNWQSDLLSSVALHRGHIAPALCLPHREEICVSSPVSSAANWPLSEHEHPVRGPQLHGVWWPSGCHSKERPSIRLCLRHSWSSHLLLEESPGIGEAEAGRFQICIPAELVTTF